MEVGSARLDWFWGAARRGRSPAGKRLDAGANSGPQSHPLALGVFSVGFGMQWLSELPFADNRVLQIGFLAVCGIAALIVLPGDCLPLGVRASVARSGRADASTKARTRRCVQSRRRAPASACPPRQRRASAADRRAERRAGGIRHRSRRNEGCARPRGSGGGDARRRAAPGACAGRRRAGAASARRRGDSAAGPAGNPAARAAGGLPATAPGTCAPAGLCASGLCAT